MVRPYEVYGTWTSVATLLPSMPREASSPDLPTEKLTYIQNFKSKDFYFGTGN
jgi:hypothetical protein